MLELTWVDVATGEMRDAVVVEIDEGLYVRRSDATDQFKVEEDRDGRPFVFHCNVERTTRMHLIGEYVGIEPSHWSSN